jgi:hypothetical protein
MFPSPPPTLLLLFFLFAHYEPGLSQSTGRQREPNRSQNRGFTAAADVEHATPSGSSGVSQHRPRLLFSHRARAEKCFVAPAIIMWTESSPLRDSCCRKQTPLHSNKEKKKKKERRKRKKKKNMPHSRLGPGLCRRHVSERAGLLDVQVLLDIHVNHLGARVIGAGVDDPPGQGQGDGADEDDAVVVHGLDGGGERKGEAVEDVEEGDEQHGGDVDGGAPSTEVEGPGGEVLSAGGHVGGKRDGIGHGAENDEGSGQVEEGGGAAQGNGAEGDGKDG